MKKNTHVEDVYIIALVIKKTGVYVWCGHSMIPLKLEQYNGMKEMIQHVRIQKGDDMAERLIRYFPGYVPEESDEPTCNDCVNFDLSAGQDGVYGVCLLEDLYCAPNEYTCNHFKQRCASRVKEEVCGSKD